MKKFAKKLWNIFFCCLLGLGAFIFAVGCDEVGTQGGNQTPSQTAEISFSVKEKTLTIGNEEYLIPTYKRLNGYTLTYSSSNESAVRVDEKGKISAEGEGVAKITATYSNGTNKAEASVQVTSTFGGYLPELNMMGVDNSIALTLDSTYQLLPYIGFNGKRFEDMSLTYSIGDNSVAEVTDEGEIIAKAKGKTTVLVEATWRGKDKTNTPTMQKTFSLSVIDNVWFYNGEKTVADEELFILGEFEGVSYKNYIPCDFTVVANGENLAPTIVIDNEEVLEKQGERLVAKGFGSTLVTVYAENEEGRFSTTFTVTVLRMKKTVENTVPLFETVDGTYLDVEDGQRKNVLAFLDETMAAVDAYQGTKKLRIVDGKIYGVESSSESGRGTAEITVGTAEVIYSFRLETIAKGIYTAEDLKALELSDGEVLKGYYEVMRDIDATGVELNHVAKNGACFSGVFNGAGHTIKNLALLQNSSMFGVLNATAIVKNVALVNCNATKAYFLAHDTLNDGLTVTDVYISLSKDTVTPRGITGRMASNSVLKNVVIEYLGENAQANRNYSERWTWQGLIGGLWRYELEGNYYAQDKKWNNVYVISPFVVAFRTDEKWADVQDGAVYGYGANETTDIYGNSLEKSVHERPNPNLGEHFYTESYCNALFTNLYHYASYEALSGGQNDFSSFSSEYWVAYDNQIFWKTDVERKVTVGIYDGETPIEGDVTVSEIGKTLGVKAFLAGKRTTDVEVTLSKDDYLVWNGRDNVLRVNNLPEAETVQVEVTVKFKVGSEEIVRTLTITVKPDVRFYNDGEKVADEELFILGEFEGLSYKNYIPCDFTVVANGENLTPTIIIDDETVLAHEGDRLVAKGFGSTVVTIYAENEEGSFSTTFTVTVLRMEKTIDKTVPMFETVDGTYLDLKDGQRKSIFTLIEEEVEIAEIVDAYQGERKLHLENGKIYGVESSSKSGISTVEITVGTATVLYSIRLETLAKAIYNAEDLKALELSDGEVLNGYYELLRDIDATGVVLNHVAKNGECFSGVFNGAGHTIKNLTLLQDSSMFGVLDGSATVKNVALVNCNATKAYFLAHDTLNDGLTVTDVYISLSEDTVTPRGITGRMANNSVLKNVVIEYLGENAQANRNYSDRWTWQGLIGGVWRYESEGNYYAQDKKWNNVYVISPFVVAFRTDEKWADVQNGAVYGYGANETTDIYGNSLEKSVYERPNPNLGDYFWTESYCNALFTNLYHYASYEALSGDNRDLSSFSSEYWVVYENQIFWKGEFEKMVTVGVYDGENPITGDIRLSKVGQTLGVKAFVKGKQVAAEVAVVENGYLVWDSQQKVLKAVQIPRTKAVRVEITVTIKVGEVEIVRTLTILLKATVVEPIQPGGDYNADDYVDPDTVLVEPIQPGGDYSSDEYDAEKMQ